METPESFANVLLVAAAGVAMGARAVVTKGALNIKTEARSNVHQSAPIHNAHAAEAITYDEPTLLGTQVTSEVGYDRDLPGGALGNLLEYGGGGDKSPAHRDIGRAADSAEARFADGLQIMATKLL